MISDEEALLVTISGPALAMLHFENRRIHDQIGFLLGDIFTFVTKEVTDSEDLQHLKRHIHIKSIAAYPIGDPFFNSIGQIDREKLESLLGSKVKQIVGWYHFRNNYDLKLTIRDKNLHTEMSNFFSHEYLTKENFLCCILTCTKSDDHGTHRFRHILLRGSGKKFEPITLKINNLGVDATRPDGTDYKSTPKYYSKEGVDGFQLVCNEVANDLQKCQTSLQRVQMIEQSAEKCLDRLILENNKYDKIISEQEHELHNFRNNKFRGMWERSQLEQQMQKMEVDTKSPNKSETKPHEPQKSPILSPSYSGKKVKTVLRKEFASGDQAKGDSTQPEVKIVLEDIMSSPTTRLNQESAQKSPVSGTNVDRQKTPKLKQKVDSYIESSVKQFGNREDTDS